MKKICVAVFALLSFAVAVGTEVVRPVEMVCHYMQWFDFRLENGLLRRFHWKWNGKTKSHNPDRFDSNHTRDIYSVLYPRIGVYDSTDPAVIDYHILAAKSCGISAFVVDYYSEFDERFTQLLGRAVELNFKAGICYEEKTCWPDWVNNRAGIRSREDAMALAVREFRALRKSFDHPAYWRRNGRPVVMVFGHVYTRPKGWGEAGGEWRFTTEEWRRILHDSGCEDVELVLQQLRGIEAGFNTFLWRHGEEFAPQADALAAAGKLGFYIGTIGPGFDDRGVNGWDQGSRVDPNLGDEQIRKDFAIVDAGRCDTVQVVTWNDFAEGTCVEPTFQYGNLYLELLGEWFGRRNGREYEYGRTQLPYRWYVLAKRFGTEAAEPIRQALKEGDFRQAATRIDVLCRERGYRIPAMIGRDCEFPIYSVTTREAAESVPKVPKEKFLLVLLGGQSNMAGRGKVEAEDRMPDPRILMLTRTGCWIPASDPVHFDFPSAGVGPARSFARKLADANPDCVIGLIPAAVGNSSIRQFVPGVRHPQSGGYPYDDLVARAKRAMRDGTLCAILWHQGESSLGSEADAKAYRIELENFLKQLRRELRAPEVPFLVGEVRYREGSEENRILNQGLRDFAGAAPKRGFISAEGLTLFDGIHFDRNSQRILGERYFEAFRIAVSTPAPPQAVNLLPVPELTAGPDGKSVQGWRIVHNTKRRTILTTQPDGSLEIRPESGSGKSVTSHYSQVLKLPARQELTGSIWVKGDSVVRLYATSFNWKPVPLWQDRSSVAGTVDRNGGGWEQHTFRFTAPGEEFPVYFRFDIDSDGPVLVAEPTLTPVRSEGEF